MCRPAAALPELLACCFLSSPSPVCPCPSSIAAPVQPTWTRGCADTSLSTTVHQQTSTQLVGNGRGQQGGSAGDMVCCHGCSDWAAWGMAGCWPADVPWLLATHGLHLPSSPNVVLFLSVMKFAVNCNVRSAWPHLPPALQAALARRICGASCSGEPCTWDTLRWQKWRRHVSVCGRAGWVWGVCWRCCTAARLLPARVLEMHGKVYHVIQRGVMLFAYLRSRHCRAGAAGRRRAAARPCFSNLPFTPHPLPPLCRHHCRTPIERTPTGTITISLHDFAAFLHSFVADAVCSRHPHRPMQHPPLSWSRWRQMERWRRRTSRTWA